MAKLLMLKSLPAGGKTTFAKSLVDAGWVRVNRDDIRAMCHNGKWSKSNERFVVELRNFVIRENLKNGKDVVVDDCNLNPKNEDDLRGIASEFNADFEVKLFDVDVQECINRDSKRLNSVGREVIMGMYNQYLKPKPPLPPRHDDSLMDCYLIDLDGTVALMNGRRGPFDWKLVGGDDLNEPVADLVRKLLDDKTAYVIFVSGRDGCCRTETEEWLDRHFGKMNYHSLLMRAIGDNRKDSIVKREIFDNHIKSKFNVRCVLDDRDQVVRMWRDLGLTCLQVADGNF